MSAISKSIPIDIIKIRSDFPILSRKINGNPLIYFDNAATSQTPQQVIDVITDYYSSYNANIHRGVHHLSQEATDAYESARRTLKTHINAQHDHEIIFTSGSTHSINLIANGMQPFVGEGDKIMVSAMEHHSNIVPWQMLCEKTGCELVVIPMHENGELDLNAYAELLSNSVKLVVFNHVSNTLGTINPAKKLTRMAREVRAAVVVDGAQACPHIKPDVQELDVDFYVTSGHKMCGPTGIGMLYGKSEWLEKMPPYQGGGEMIAEVTFEKTSYAELPHKFEAGTPNVCGAIAFGAAVDYMNGIGFDRIQAYEHELLSYATKKLQDIEGLKIYGASENKTSVISFNVGSIHPYDLGTLLDKMGIAVRTGHHCTQPIMDYYQIPGTVRASLSFYNTFEEIDRFAECLNRAISMLS